MSRRRWIADEVQGNHAALTGANAVHLARVLRAAVGQKFEVAARGRVYLATIRAIGDERVEFELDEQLPTAEIPDLTLLLAVFKFDRFEWAIEKCTELGVARIVPLLAQRSDAHLAQSASKRVERWRRIAHQAAQQCRRATPPEIAPPAKLKDASFSRASRRIVLAESEQATMLKQALARLDPSTSLALAVGPEGGWTQDELRQFGNDGWIAARLGPTILRAETAAIAALAIVMAELGCG